ncbi:glycine cleavage system protein H [Anaeromyxobacter sp. PSR-1]|uniref:glycine cleavage system protein H n=1 Tax=Anaeromyxobacter sp. PSR-1 TaxID=1300915 RepID=UPI0005DB75F8|nr:glycine cleavage system protein H [Anaeromyxobacter sp. PSR-1]GAO01504.1 glycine cleavage system H protein [Anaeromyxobacter sp. PSR-1]
MPEYLQITADKFTFRVATDRVYSPEGMWFLPEKENRVRVGFSDFMQQHNGDVAFLTVKAPGTRLEVGDELVELETVKVTQAVPTPIAGTIVDVNGSLELTPEVVNKDPYGDGWLAVIEPANWERDHAKLLDARAYLPVMQSQVEQELEKP